MTDFETESAQSFPLAHTVVAFVSTDWRELLMYSKVRARCKTNVGYNVFTTPLANIPSGALAFSGFTEARGGPMGWAMTSLWDL